MTLTRIDLNEEVAQTQHKAVCCSRFFFLCVMK